MLLHLKQKLKPKRNTTMLQSQQWSPEPLCLRATFSHSIYHLHLYSYKPDNLKPQPFQLKL